jgi:hypothetical protein
MAIFSESDLFAISRAFEDSGIGLSDSELAEIFERCGIRIQANSNDGITQVLSGSLHNKQIEDGNRRGVLAFLRVAMDPGRYQDRMDDFAPRRQKLNDALAFSGIVVGDDGSLGGSENVGSNLIRSLLNGDIPLVQTYWLYGFLGGTLVQFPVRLLEYNLSNAAYSENANFATLALIIVFSTLSFFYSVFMFVAIWRSANKYHGPSYWVLLAKGMVVIGIAFVVLKIVTFLMAL